MIEMFKGSRLAVAQEPCCLYAVHAEHQKLKQGMKHLQKSMQATSPALKSFYSFKAVQKLQEVALQDIYPKGRAYAIQLLRFMDL